MDRLRQKLSAFMRGRNGMDKLGKTVFFAALVLYVCSGFIRNSLLYSLALAGLVYTIYRILSKNIKMRQEENRKYLQFLNLQKMRFKMRKEYRIFKCKGCGRNIRIPKGKGKLEITCPVCGRRVIHRT